MSKAIEDVKAERQRQISKEGHSLEDDDKYQNSSQLIQAACCYAANAAKPVASIILPDNWPWHARFWKPKSPRQDLVRAAALLVAEIERIDRALGQ